MQKKYNNTTRYKSYSPSFYNLLEPILAYFRYKTAEKYINKGDVVLDIGCGFKGNLLKKISNKTSLCIGLDLKVQNHNQFYKNQNIRLVKHNFNNGTLPELMIKFDAVVCLAVLEHIEKPNILIENIYKVLKKEGVAIITTPHKNSKKILEFLSYKLNLISPVEIKDHKRYFSKEELIDMFKKANFKYIEHKYIPYKLNNLIVARKYERQQHI